jgi:hypothetical protein
MKKKVDDELRKSQINTVLKPSKKEIKKKIMRDKAEVKKLHNYKKFVKPITPILGQGRKNTQK